MPREFVPIFYAERSPAERTAVGVDWSDDGKRVYVLFTGGEWATYKLTELALALGVPTAPDLLAAAILREPYAVLRAIPGSFRQM